jgi:DNA-binding MarR family transcriptional regulator
MTTDPISAMDFCLRLARANAVLVRRFDSALGTYHGISFADFQILNHLAQAPDGKLRRIDLAERVGLTASGVTRALLPLEKIGLVSRESDPRDARVGLALITATGRELAGNATDVVNLISGELTRGAPPAQLAGMAALLGTMAGIHAGNA